LDSALYFPRAHAYPFAVSNFSFSTTYSFGFFGYNRWGPRSRVQ
jgi:hypothetical protein